MRVLLFVPLLNLAASIDQIDNLYNNSKYILPKSEIGFIFLSCFILVKILNILGDRLELLPSVYGTYQLALSTGSS